MRLFMLRAPAAASARCSCGRPGAAPGARWSGSTPPWETSSRCSPRRRERRSRTRRWCGFSRKPAWHVASRGDDLRSELEYYRIQEELQRDELKDEDDKPAEDTREKSAFSTEDSSLAALQIVPFVANPMVPASNTSPEPHLELLDSADISCEINEHIEGCCRMASDLRMALKLENLDYRIVQKCQSTRTDPRHTSSYPTEPKVYGRDQERDLIISKLTSEESAGQNLSVLAIIGNGGVGKTTLAQVVFNDSAVSKHFDILLWDYVSVHFDQAKIMHELLESLLGDRYENIKGLKELQDILEYAFKSKRVLLVLDDMWEDSQKEKWDELLTPLLSNDVKGNKVLVTTRKPSVANLIGATDHINLDGLKPDDFWYLFKACAFGDENYKGERKLEKIGRKIIVKLKGNPLAAKSVGKVLKRSRDVDYWTRILDNSEWKDKEEDDDIMPALMISYKYLPVHLQQCFSYCAVFPKYHRYEKERLVNIWIAQGLICSTDMRRCVEDIGSEFFNDLVEWGFFQKDFGLSTLLIMHDLIHDLAQKVSSDESFTIEDNEPRDAPRLVRHVSIITEREYKTDLDGTVHPNEPFLQEFSNSFGKLQQRNLCTLMLFGPHDLDFANTFRQEFNEPNATRGTVQLIPGHRFPLSSSHFSSFASSSSAPFASVSSSDISMIEHPVSNEETTGFQSEVKCQEPHGFVKDGLITEDNVSSSDTLVHLREAATARGSDDSHTTDCNGLHQFNVGCKTNGLSYNKPTEDITYELKIPIIQLKIDTSLSSIAFKLHNYEQLGTDQYKQNSIGTEY